MLDEDTIDGVESSDMPTVLIIEDDKLVSRMYEKVFTTGGFTVLVAENGKVGIQLAQENSPDVIFCDVMMPKMNGLQVLESLKQDEKTKNIPIAMLTNLSGTQDSEKAIQNGAVTYLVKSQHKPKDILEKAQEILAANPTAAVSETSSSDESKSVDQSSNSTPTEVPKQEATPQTPDPQPPQKTAPEQTPVTAETQPTTTEEQPVSAVQPPSVTTETLETQSETTKQEAAEAPQAEESKQPETKKTAFREISL